MSQVFARLSAELVRRVSGALVLPFDTSVFGSELENYYDKFSAKYKSQLESLNVSLADLERAVQGFKRETRNFDQKLLLIDRNQYNLVRQFNEQLRNLERSFLDFWSLKNTGFMHTLSAPSPHNRYISDLFPFVSQAILSYNQSPTPELLNNVKQQLSIVIYSIHSATSVLQDPASFERD